MNKGSEANTLYKVWLTLRWVFGIHHKLYHEVQPNLNEVDMTMQRLAMSLSLGRLTWGKAALTECKCKVCGITYWTLTRGSQVCKRYGCYMKFHLHPEQFTLQRGKTHISFTVRPKGKKPQRGSFIARR